MQELRIELSVKLLTHFLKKYEEGKWRIDENLQYISQANTKLLISSFTPLILEDINNLKQNTNHLKLYLKILEKMQKDDYEQVKDIIQNLIQKQIKCSIDQSTMKNQITPEQIEQQNTRNEVLKSVIVQTLRLNEQITTQLVLQFFEIGKAPPILILQFLKIISEELKTQIKSYTKDIIPRFLSSCSTIKQEELQIQYCEVLGSVYNNLLLCIENKEYINMDQIIDMTLAIFQIVYNDWIENNHSQGKKASLWLAGILIKFLPKENVEKSIEGIIREYVTQIRRRVDSELIDGFVKVLERLFDDNIQYFEEIVKSVLVSLNEQYKSCIFSNNYPFNQEQFQEKNNLLKLLQNLAIFNLDNTVDFFIHRHISKDYVERNSSLWITNFLISRNLTALSYQVKKQLIASLQNQILETDIEIRYSLCEIMLTICNNQDFLEQINLDSSFSVDFILYFLVKQASIHDDEIKERKLPENPPFETTLASLKKRALYILQLLTQDAKQGIIVWPFFLEFIPNPNMSPGISHILKAINNYIQKYKEQYDAYPEIKPKYQNKIPKIQTILARLMVLLKIPNFFPNLGVEIINSLQNILEVYIQVPVSNELLVVIRDLKFAINKPNSEERYEDLLHLLWTRILDHFKSHEWFSIMHEDLIAVQDTYKAKSEQLLGHLIKMHGQLLTKMHNNETIKYQIDKFFQIVHNDFSGMQLNLNISPLTVSKQLRMNVAEAFGYVSQKYFDLVVDKIRNILNCEVIQKKQQGGFGSSLLGVFKKQEGADDRFQDMYVTILLIFGQICYKADPIILSQKVENSIINNILPFFDKPNEQIQMSLQYSILQLSKSFEEIIDNSDEERKKEIIHVVATYRDKLLGISRKNFSKKNLELKLLAQNSICSLLRMQPPLIYNHYLSFLTDSLKIIPDIEDPGIGKFKSLLSNVFLTFISHKQIQKSEDEILQTQEQLSDFDIIDDSYKFVSCYERLTLIINTIDKNECNINSLQFFYEATLNAIMNFKEKINNKKDKKFVLQSFSVLLSHIFKKQTDLSRICLLCLEKILLGFDIYINVQMRSIDEFNLDFISQISKKISYEEIYLLVNDNIQKYQDEKNIEVLRGFLSFAKAFYEHFINQLTDKFLEKAFSNFKQLFDMIKRSGQGNDNDDERIVQCILTILEKNLEESLDVLLSENVIFPISDFLQLIFRRISKTKHLLFKSFNHFTDVINNPEDIQSKLIGNMMTNSIMFIGYMLEFSEDLLRNLSNKFFYHIFGTFLLRFATCFDTDYRPIQTEDLKNYASKITLWAFEVFLKHTEKKHLLYDFSQGLMVKLISEEQFEDGVTELVMILCKNSTLNEIKQLLDFLKPFIEKSQEKQRGLCFIVVSQLISSSHFTLDFYKDKITEDQKQNVKIWYTYLIETILNNSTDVSERIRDTIFKGIGNITYLFKYNIATNQQQLDQFQKQEIDNKQDVQQKVDDANSQHKKAGTLNVSEITDLENETGENQDTQKESYFIMENSVYANILETLFAALDDSSEVCISDALNSLQNIIDFVDHEFAQNFVINLMLKVATSFEKQNVKLRQMAFNLFGKLVESFSSGEEFQEFKNNQLQVALISIIVHLNDESLQVRSVCKLTLQRVGKALNLKELVDMISNKKDKMENELVQFEQSEQFLIQVISFLIDQNQDKIELYGECLLEFSKAPEDNISCGGFVGLMYIMSKLSKQDFSKNLLEKINARFEKILEGNINSSLSSAMLKGVFFFALSLKNDNKL